MGFGRRHLLIGAVPLASVLFGGCRGCTGIDDFDLEDGPIANAGGAAPATGTGASPAGQGGGLAGSGGTGGEGASSSSGGGDCTPCYAGPPGTEGEGTCRAGARCGEGVCEGEVLPLAADDCFTTDREDCEPGAGATCTATPRGHGVITESQQFLFGLQVPIAGDAEGRTVGAAAFQDATYFDGTPLDGGAPSIVVWGLDADLTPTWRATRPGGGDGTTTPRSIAMEGDDVVLASYRIQDAVYVLDVEHWVWGDAAPASTRSFLNPSGVFAVTNSTARARGTTFVAFCHDGSADLDGDGEPDGESTDTLHPYVGALDDDGNTIWSIAPVPASDVAVHAIVAVGDDLWLSGMTVEPWDLGCAAPIPADSAFLAAVDLLSGECRVARAVASLGGLAQLEFTYSLVTGSERGIAATFPPLAPSLAFYDLEASEQWSVALDPALGLSTAFTDAFGHVVVAGSIGVGDATHAFARKLDRAAGDPVWPADVTLASTSYVQFTGGAGLPDGGTMLGGSFVGDATLEEITYSSNESASSFFYAVAP